MRRTGTVSPLDIEVQKQKVQALYEDWKDKPATDTRQRLEKAVGKLQRDASVVSDTAVARQSEEALQVIKDAVTPDQTGVFRAIQGLAPEKAPQMPAPQVVQLVDAPGAEIDKELLDIFLEEAGEVLDTIASHLTTCLHAPHDREALTTIRRGFHTLKGSGRMVGLTELGEMAWQCEQVMNKWLKDDKPASPDLLAFIGLARESFLRWVGELKQGGAAAIDGAEIIRQAEALKSDQKVAPVPAAETAAPSPAPELATEPSPPEPVEEAMELDFAALAPEPSTPLTPEPEPAPAQPAAPAFDFESLDLGAAPAAVEPEAAPAALEPESQPPPTPAVPDLAELVMAAPEPAIVEGTAAEPQAESPAPEAEETVTIGSATLPAALFAIYLGEAEQHVALLNAQMSRIEADPLHPVGADFMRAAHTLSSSSRTTGFEGLADAAYALEKWLQDAMELPPEFNAHRLEVTRAAIDALTAMVESVRGRAMPFPREDVIEQLARLREGLREARKTGQGTHIRMPGVVREALEARAEARTGSEIPAQAPPEEPAAEAAPEESAPETLARPAEPEMQVPEVHAERLEPAVHATQEYAEPAPMERAPAPEEAMPAFAPPAAVGDAPVAVHAEAPGAPAQPAGERPFEAGKEQRKITDDVDRDLLPVFLVEAREIVPAVSEGVRRWKAAPSDHSHAADLQRHLHTLKGSARMTGLMRLGELAHVLETRINAIDEVEAPQARQFEEIEERVDRFSLALERLGRGEDIVEAEPIQVPVGAVFEQQKDKPAGLAVIAAAAQEVAQRDALPPELRESRAALLRVNADMIDRFVNEAGELSIARLRIEGEMAAFKRALVDLTDNISRMRSQLREIEIASEGQMQSTIKLKEETGETFDPLEFDRFSRMQELTRFLAESLGDVITLHQGLQKNLDETELAIHAQARLNRDLQQGLMGVRLVPLGNLADRFYRIVRQTAKELDKKANLELKGTRTELDRSVLEKITGPFEHLLRNAIAHGLETPEERVRAGKPEIGEIAIDAAQRGNEVVLSVSRRRRGPELRAHPAEGGRIRPARPRRGAARSAARAVHLHARVLHREGGERDRRPRHRHGRGQERDHLARRAHRHRLRGRAGNHLQHHAAAHARGHAGGDAARGPDGLCRALGDGRPGAGIQGPGVRGGGGRRRGGVEGQSLPAALAAPAAGRDRHRYSRAPDPGAAAQERRAARGDPRGRDPRQPRDRGEDHRAAALAAGGNRRRHRARHGPGGAHPQPGAARAPRGAGGGRAAARRARGVPAPLVVEQKSGAPLVMVVDDSLTVRKITGRMLAREGYEVATAKDGVDALQQLQDVLPGLHPARRRDAAHGRLRVRAQRARRRGDARDPDHHDHLAHRRQAPQPRARDRRERVHGQALPGRPAARADQALHAGIRARLKPRRFSARSRAAPPRPARCGTSRRRGNRGAPRSG